MRKPEELFNGIFITPETREKIREAAGERSEKDINQYVENFYNALDKALKMIAVSIPDTKEYIIYTPERRIGKSRALLKLANDYGAVIVAKEHERDCLRQMAKELGYTEQCIVSLSELQRKLPGNRIRTIIKTETVKLADIRKQERDYYIVGIEEV
jgi:predicted kinase